MSDIGMFLSGAVAGGLLLCIVLLVYGLPPRQDSPKAAPVTMDLLQAGPLAHSHTESIPLPTEARSVHADVTRTHAIDSREKWNSLTLRQRQVAKYVAQGLSNPEVAAVLSIESSTVNAHLKLIYGTLGIHSRTELANVVRDLEAKGIK